MRPGLWRRLDGLFGAVEQTAEYLYQRGATVAALGGNPTEVVALYERAVAVDPRHSGALFGLALESDRRGDDEAAFRLVRACGPRISGTCWSSVEFGDHVRGHAAIRASSVLLSADPWTAIPNHPRAQAVLQGCGGFERHVL